MCLFFCPHSVFTARWVEIYCRRICIDFSWQIKHLNQRVPCIASLVGQQWHHLNLWSCQNRHWSMQLEFVTVAMLCTNHMWYMYMYHTPTLLLLCPHLCWSKSRLSCRNGWSGMVDQLQACIYGPIDHSCKLYTNTQGPLCTVTGQWLLTVMCYIVVRHQNGFWAQHSTSAILMLQTSERFEQRFCTHWSCHGQWVPCFTVVKVTVRDVTVNREEKL